MGRIRQRHGDRWVRSENAPLRRWRPTVAMLVTMWLLTVGLIATAAWAALLADSLLAGLPIGAVFFGCAAVCAAPTMNRIDLYPDRVVTKSLHPRTRVIPLETIRTVTAHTRLQFQTGPYTWIPAPRYVGDKGGLLVLLSITTRGDRIAETIVSHAEAYRAVHPDARPEIEQVADELAATLAVAGHGAEAKWIEESVRRLRDLDGAPRWRALRDLHEAAVGTTGHLKDIYLGTNGEFFRGHLERLATLTED